MSQQQVASALGIKVSRYGDWERETTMLGFIDAIHLADLFRCNLDDLAGRIHRTINGLSVDERVIVNAYRTTDDRGKSAIMLIAENQAGIERKPKTGPQV